MTPPSQKVLGATSFSWVSQLCILPFGLGFARYTRVAISSVIHCVHVCCLPSRHCAVYIQMKVLGSTPQRFWALQKVKLDIVDSTVSTESHSRPSLVYLDTGHEALSPRNQDFKNLNIFFTLTPTLSTGACSQKVNFFFFRELGAEGLSMEARICK